MAASPWAYLLLPVIFVTCLVCYLINTWPEK